MKTIFTFLLFTISLNSCGVKSNPVDLQNAIIKSLHVNDKNETFNTQGQNVIFKVGGNEKKDWTDIWLPIIAAFIVSFAAYRGVLKQSKASSISGFRVSWIEDLRISYSKFLIALRNVDNKIRNGIIVPNYYTKDSDEEDLQFLKTKIKLLLNHNPLTNPEHVTFYRQLLQYMEEHKECYRGQFSEEKFKALDTSKAKMEEVLLTIFKKEWDKAKKFG